MKNVKKYIIPSKTGLILSNFLLIFQHDMKSGKSCVILKTTLPQKRTIEKHIYFEK